MTALASRQIGFAVCHDPQQGLLLKPPYSLLLVVQLFSVVPLDADILADANLLRRSSPPARL